MYVIQNLPAFLNNASLPSSAPLVAILSNDPDIRPALEVHISQMGWRPELHGSAASFIAGARGGSFGCVVVDAEMTGLTASELTQLICLHAVHCPIIVLTAKPSAAMTVTTSKFRVTFMPKPDDLSVLTDEVNASIRAVNETNRLEAHFLTLTPRERQVMEFVAEGLLNKQVAFKLNISEITVKAHRGQVMRKMNARTLPDLIKMVARLGPAAGSMAGSVSAF